MTSQPSPSRTTALENLRVDPSGAQFDLNGHAVQLDAARHAMPVAALQAFYYQAVADYHARVPAPRPGLLIRAWSWLTRLFGGGAEPRPAPPAPAADPARGQPAPPAPSRKPEPAWTVSAPSPTVRPEAPAAPIPPPVHPVLQSAFADKDGLHLVWRPPAEKPPTQNLELTYPLDSGLARRLEDCYGQLSQLGYKVVGLEILRPEREARPAPEKPSQPPAPRPEAPPAEPKASPPKPKPAAEKSQLILKITPAKPEPPARLPDQPNPTLPEP